MGEIQSPDKTLARRLRWEELDVAYLRQLISLAREEDEAGAGLRELPARPGDVTTGSLPDSGRGRAWLVAREPLVISGMELIELVLEGWGIANFEPLCKDGDRLEAGTRLGVLSGSFQVLLSAERSLLNFLQHLSGIATLTRQMVEALGPGRTRLLDTRKTHPAYRMLEKYAVGCGGGWNHRLGLFDRIMLKDNHLGASGANDGTALRELIYSVRRRSPGIPLEVEVDTLTQLDAVLEAEPDVVLLDNFSNEDLCEAVKRVAGRTVTEASGGITLERLPQLAGLGLDFVSSGAMVHQSRWVDIGLDWDRPSEPR